jgi:hypothetical protein
MRYVIVVFCVSILVFSLYSIAWPLSGGRDLYTYILYYYNLLDQNTVYPMLMLYRGLIPSVFAGLVLQYLGAVGTEVVLGVMYATAITLIYLVGRQWAKPVSLVAVLALFLYPPYAALFHTLSSDVVYAFLLTVWLYLVLKTVEKPKPRMFILNAVVVFALILTRPSAQIYWLFGAIPLLFYGLSWRHKANLAAWFLIPLALMTMVFSCYNNWRYGDFAVSRSAKATMPLYRVFLVDKLVGPDNGPVSREIAGLISTDLLTREPYRSYGISMEEFYNSGSTRMYWDLVSLADRHYGWDSDYKQLRVLAIEAIRQNPIRYARGVLRTFNDYLLKNHHHSVTRLSGNDYGNEETPQILSGLPMPSEGQPIPASNLWWMASTPSQSTWTNWDDLAKPYLEFSDAGVEASHARITRGSTGLVSMIPSRDGVSSLSNILNAITRMFPPILLFVVMAGLLYQQRKSHPFLFVLSIILFKLALIAAALPTDHVYRIPHDPIIILLGIAGAAQLFGVIAKRYRPMPYGN